MKQSEIKKEMDEAIKELQSRGVKFNDGDEKEGLGDIVEGVLTSLGITQEKFKKWFNLQECNCNKRKKWLNNVFSWKKDKN